jgi:N-acetylglucosamine kinase-like BadF-type ATPase
VGIVAATGATAFGMRADDGREVMMGGWGSLLGDEGSAFAMGLMALRCAVRVFEGRDKTPTRLIEAICRHYEIEPDNFHRGLVYLAYQKPLSRAEIGGLAAVVTGLAEQGDEAALRITAKTAGDLAALAMHVVRRLFGAAETFDVVVAGGLTNAGDLILGPLRSQMAQAYPNAALKIGVDEPAASLGRLALFDSPVDSQIEEE